MKYLLIYLLLINAAGLVLMLADKIRARNGAWRISALTLMLTAALGGSVGVHMGMYLFRPQTRHPKFTLGVPAILTVQILLAWLLLK